MVGQALSLVPTLKLTDEEFALLSEETADFMQVLWESKIDRAKVSRGSGGEIIIQVLSNPEDALELSTMFAERLAVRLPSGRFRQIYSALKELFLQNFEGYGAGDEQYTFTPNHIGSGHYRFDYNIKIPEFVNAASNHPFYTYGGSGGASADVQLKDLERQPRMTFILDLLEGEGGYK